MPRQPTPPRPTSPPSALPGLRPGTHRRRLLRPLRHAAPRPAQPLRRGARAPGSAGVCDIGKRHARNEDAMALSATEPPGQRAVLVVCDGVSMATDSHIASLAAARGRAGSARPALPQGRRHPGRLGGRRRPGAHDRRGPRPTTPCAPPSTSDVPNPPVVHLRGGGRRGRRHRRRATSATAGSTGCPTAPSPPRQLGRDDSFAQEQMPRRRATRGGRDRPARALDHALARQGRARRPHART